MTPWAAGAALAKELRGRADAPETMPKALRRGAGVVS